MISNVKNPLISVIVPVFNAEPYLDICIESILKQTYSNIEVLLIDDGSKDDSFKKCCEWSQKDSRVKCFTKQNGGASSARNYGLDVCSGDYIGFVDSDDYISERMYEELLLLVIEHSDAIGQTMIEDVFPDRKECDVSFYDFVEENYVAFLKGLCLQKRSSSFCSKLFPKEFFKNIRFEEGKTNEDFLLFFSISENSKYRIICTRTVGYYYVQRIDSITHKDLRVYEDAISNSLNLYESYGNSELRLHIARFYLHYCTRYLLLCVKNNNKTYKLFCSTFKKNIRTDNISLKNKYLGKAERYVLRGFLSFPILSFAFFRIGFCARRLIKHDKRTT